MPFSKVSKHHQITIPKPVYDGLELSAGDLVEVILEKDRAILVPARVISRSSVPKLSVKEQKVLKSARRKIKAIRKDLIDSKGLTETEADVAARVGLIDLEQKWWWLEEWQMGEREAERDDRAGRFEEFDSPEAFLKTLKV